MKTSAEYAKERWQRIQAGTPLNPLNPLELGAIERVAEAERLALMLEAALNDIAEDRTPWGECDPWIFWRGLHEQARALRRQLSDIDAQAHYADHVNAECEEFAGA